MCATTKSVQEPGRNKRRLLNAGVREKPSCDPLKLTRLDNSLVVSRSSLEIVFPSRKNQDESAASSTWRVLVCLFLAAVGPEDNQGDRSNAAAAHILNSSSRGAAFVKTDSASSLATFHVKPSTNYSTIYQVVLVLVREASKQKC